MNKLITLASEGQEVLTNEKLTIPHTRIQWETNKTGASTWGSNEKTITINQSDYPFDWMNPQSKNLAIISELAKRSDRLLMIYPRYQQIPATEIFFAAIHKKIVKVYQGTKPVDITNLLKNSIVQEDYQNIILPTLETIPIPTKLLTTPNGATLRAYQQQMVNFSLQHPRSGQFVDMGLGKTLATLATINEWILDGTLDPTKPILVVAPIMVAIDTWSREAEKWGYDWDVKVNIRLTPKKRDDLLHTLTTPQSKVTLVTTNPAQLSQIKMYFDSRHIPLPFECIIVDELSLFKSANSQRVATLKQYLEEDSLKRFIGLTGMPSPNHLLDVWSQLALIDHRNTDWMGRSIYDFQDKFFDPVFRDNRGFVRKWKPKPGAKDTIFRKMSESVISMETTGLVELPLISYTNQYITLPPKAQKMYTEMDKEVRKQMETSDGVGEYQTDNGVIRLPNSDILTAKLLQLASGAIYNGNVPGEYDTYHDAKIEALQDIIESSSSPILVMFYFKSDIERLQAKIKAPILTSKDKNVKAMIQKWNNGEIPVMFAHPDSVGHGLNLQDGGHTIVWFTLTWKNDPYRQSNKRLYRSGQKNPVSVIHLLAKGTVDETVLASLNAKQATQDEMMSVLDVMEREST